MPTYEVEIPGSGKYSVESPTDLTDKQAYFAVMQQLELEKPQAPAPVIPEAPKPEEKSFLERNITDPLMGGGKQLLSSWQTAAAGLTGDQNKAAIEGLERQRQIGQQYGSVADLGKVKEAYNKEGILSAAGEAISQIPGAISGQLPQLAPVIAGGQAGAMVGGPWGAVIGAAIPLYIQFIGSNAERQAQEQIAKGDPVNVSMGNAALAAIPQTAIDMVETRLLFGQKLFSKALGIPTESIGKIGADQVEKLAKEGLLTSLAKGTATGILAEVPSEIGQQMIERAQAGLSITSPEALMEYGDTAYQVGLLGPLGTLGRFSEKAEARRTVNKPEEIPPTLLPETPEAPSIEQPEIPGGEGPAIRGLETEFPPIGAPIETPEAPTVEAPQPPVETPPVTTPEAPAIEAPPVEAPPVAPPITEVTPPVETPPVQAPEVPQTQQILHPFEIAMQSGDANELAKMDEALKPSGIHLNFNGEGRINLNESYVKWDKMKTLRTGQKLLNHIRDFVPLDTREILDRITPYVKDIPIYFNKSDPYSDNGKLRGTHAFHQPGGKEREASRIEFLTKSPIGNTFETIAHEFVHGATVRNYYQGHHYNQYKGAKGEKVFAKPAQELNELASYLIDNHFDAIPFLRNYKQQYINRNGRFKNLESEKLYKESVAKELLTWGTTNRETQEILKSIKLPSGKSVWTKFVETMRNLLQIPATETNALSRILEVQDKLIGGKPIKPFLKTRAGRERIAPEFAQQEAYAPEESLAPRTKATGGPAPKATWEIVPLEAETSRSRYMKNKVYEYVDKFVDLKDIIKAINASSKKLDETWNAYRRETLYHNRVAWMTNQFLKNDLKPLAEDMVKRNVSEEELNNYLLARHAEDYNKRINERNKEATHLQDRGSGVETRIAQAYMNGASKQEVQNLLNLFEKNEIKLNENEKAILNDLSKMTDAKRRNLAEIAKRIDKIVKETQNISVAGGLEKQSTIDFWRDMYPNYVPLKRSQEELDFVEKNYGTGRGFSTKSGFGRAATGSLKTVDNIMANLILQRDMAIVRSEKGRIGRALYAMALQNPNPSFWLPVNPEAAAISKANDLYVQIAKQKESIQRKIEKVDADLADGKDADPADIAEISKMRDKLSKDEARHAELAAKAEQVKKSIIKELGKLEGAHGLTPDAIDNLIREPQGAWYNPATRQVEYRTNAYLRSSPNVLAIPVDGETRYIFFNPGDERAKRLINSLKSADVETLGEITSAVGKATRWIAKVNTQFNPFFGIVNMMRDVQGAQFNLSSTPLAGKQVAVDKNIPGAMATIYRSLRSERGGAGAVGPFAADWAEFQKLGGPTGIKDMLAREQDKLSVLGEEISKLQEGAAKKMGRRGWNAVFDLMSDFNDTMENSVRLAAFVEAKKKFKAQGFNDSVAADKAAELAKNLTVNFNRKGAKSQMVNSWFAFFNAAIQGSARLAETMKGPAGIKIASSLVMLGVIQQLMLASAGFDDEDPPEFVRAKNLVIPTGGGKYLSVPMPLGFNAFVNFGRILTAAGMDGGKRPAKYASDMVGMLSDSFNPFGSSGLSLQTAFPTVADPFIALGENKDAFGRPIYREDRANKPTPGYLRSSEGSSVISKTISKVLNQITGGTEYQKGHISPTADEIDYIAGQFGGGTYREAKKIVDFAQSQATGEEVAPYKIPLAGRFIGDTGSDANARSKFYQNVTQLSKYEDEIKGRAKNHQDVQAFLKEHPEARLYDTANSVENEIIQMNKLRKEMVARGAGKEQLKRLNDMKIQRMRQFNTLVEKASQQ